MPDPLLPTDSLHLRLAAANGLIRRRRSIKPADLSDSPIDPMILGNMLENANWAPTHGLTEPWRFKIFEGPARQRLADALQRIYRESTPEAQFRQEKHDGFAEKILACGAVLIIAMERQPSGKIPEWEEIAALACAVQNLHLTASAVGLGGYWSTPPVTETDDFAQFLRLTGNQRCLGLFYLGWPKNPDLWPAGRRRPVQEKVEWMDE